MYIYSKLREKLNGHPVGAPEGPEILEIFKLLFSPEEAELAIHMTITPKPVQDIATLAHLPLETTADRCESLANKGLVLAYSKNEIKYYGLLPMMPGVFEYPFMKTKDLNLDFPKLAELWHQYYDKGFGHEFHGSKTSMSRVIPVKKSLASNTEVLPFEAVANYIQKAEHIAVGDCSCRVAAQKCNKPIKTCLSFDRGARFLVERNMSKFINKGEAAKILEDAEVAGLVHVTSNTANRIGFICNCCSCCCVSLGSVTRLQGTKSHPASNFFASVDSGICNMCGICLERCPVKAIHSKDIVTINEENCIGCGLCAYACPMNAMKLSRRLSSIVPPIDSRELAIKVAGEKGRLEKFLANLC